MLGSHSLADKLEVQYSRALSDRARRRGMSPEIPRMMRLFRHEKRRALDQCGRVKLKVQLYILE